MGIAEAIVASAILGTASSVYSAQEQKKAQKEAMNAQEEARRRAEEERKRIAMETKPKGKSATLNINGASETTTSGSTNDFLIPLIENSSLGKSNSLSGLGFNI